MSESVGFGDLMVAAVRIADSLDRLVTLLEELADAMGRAEWPDGGGI